MRFGEKVAEVWDRKAGKAMMKKEKTAIALAIALVLTSVPMNESHFCGRDFHGRDDSDRR